MAAECACGLLVNGDGKLLFGLRSTSRKFYPGVWDAFGGHIEFGETVEQTLVRELEEELDITPTQFRFLTILPDPKPEQHGEYAYHIFEVRSWEGPGPRLCGDEHDEMRWCTVAEAVALDLALPAYRGLIKSLGV